MSRISRSLARVAVTMLGSLLAVRAADAQPTNARRLVLVEDFRIDAKELGGQRDPLVVVGPKGQIASTMRFGFMGISVFDSSGKAFPWKIATGRNDNSDIGYPMAIGWLGATDTMWVADVAYDQLAFVDARGKVVKSIEYPSWIHPSWSERRKYPVFGHMEPVAVYRDETMLVIPSRPRSFIDTPGFDRSMTHILRTTWSGSIQRTIAAFPEDRRAVRLHAKGCEYTVPVPFAARSFWNASVDGMRIALLDPGTSTADSGTVRLTTVNDRGDTVYSRTYPQPAVRVLQASIDNLLNSLKACGSIPVGALRDSVSKRVPQFKSFVTGMITGRDYSTWVMFRALSDTSAERTGMILDPRGEVFGVVSLPPNHTILAGDGSHLWTLEIGRMRNVAALVRFRVEQPALMPKRKP